MLIPSAPAIPPLKKTVGIWKTPVKGVMYYKEQTCLFRFNLGDDLINNEDSTLADALGQIFFSCNQSFNNPLTYNLPWTFKEDKKVSVNCHVN